MSAPLIRPPTLADVDALGRVHVRAWQAAYRGGLMPDEYLDGLSGQERAGMWREGLRNNPEPRTRACRLVAEIDGEVVGVVVAGPAGGDPCAVDGEVYSINVDPEHWGTDVGDALFAAGSEALRDAGFASAILWVHPGNARARRFYETRGWEATDTLREETLLGVTVPEIQHRIEKL